MSGTISWDSEPAAPSLSSNDTVLVGQGGTQGVPYSSTIRTAQLQALVQFLAANLNFATLPTSNPHVNGAPWNNAGFLAISAG